MSIYHDFSIDILLPPCYGLPSLLPRLYFFNTRKFKLIQKWLTENQTEFSTESPTESWRGGCITRKRYGMNVLLYRPENLPTKHCQWKEGSQSPQTRRPPAPHAAPPPNTFHQSASFTRSRSFKEFPHDQATITRILHTCLLLHRQQNDR